MTNPRKEYYEKKQKLRKLILGNNDYGKKSNVGRLNEILTDMQKVRNSRLNNLVDKDKIKYASTYYDERIKKLGISLSSVIDENKIQKYIDLTTKTPLLRKYEPMAKFFNKNLKDKT